MIIFRRVAARNFRSFETFDLPLDAFGMVLVQGIIEGGSALESNGAGKSSLFAAISWALFGKFFHVGGALVSGEQVIKRGSSGGCCVTLELFKGDDQVVINRFRGDKQYGNKIVVSVNGVDRTPSSNFKTQELIEEVLGITFELFANLVYINETSMRSSFVLEADTQRKKLLVSALPHLEQFGEAREEVKRNLDFYHKHKAEHKSQINALLEASRELQNSTPPSPDSIYIQLHSLKERFTDLSDRFVLANSIVLKLPSQEQCESQLRAKIREVATAEAAIKFHEKEVSNWKALHNACYVCSQPISPDFKETQIQVLGRTITELLDELGQLQREEEQLRSFCGQHQSLLKIKESKEGLMQSITQLQQVAAEIEQTQLKLARQKQSLERRIENLQEVSRIVDSYSQTFQVWLDGFGPRGVMSFALEHVVAILTKKSEEWLKKLWAEGAAATFGLAGDDSSKIEAKLFLNQHEVNLLSLSSGETRRVCLAICFSLRETLQALTGWSSNLLILDEINAGLDPSGSEQVIKHLKSAYGTNSSIFVISHLPTPSRLFDEHLLVHYRGNSSTLEWHTK